MRLKVNGETVYVKFFHGEDSEGRWTEATIEAPSFPSGRITGMAFCHPRDQYSRRKGRLQALNNAFFGTRGTRGIFQDRRVYREWTTPFWAEYFQKQPNDKKA